MDPAALRISDEIAEALQSARPVVALESALLSFGLPAPLNLETYLEMENVIRRAGAIPAGTAVLAGHPCLGLSRPDVERLADRAGCEKASVADLAWVAASGRPGATTVASTMAIASTAGCRVFATGGIGGVHPGVAEDLDISGDLAALGRYSMGVVCSGAKAILDVPKTLELLEAIGVAVVGIGTSEFPLFYSRSSRRPIRSVATVSEAASVVRQQRLLGLPGGVLLGNPVPAASALSLREVQGWLDQAEGLMREAGITGRDRTPFLLGRLAELSGGRTVATNRALLVDNARVAAELAVTLSAMEGAGPPGRGPLYGWQGPSAGW